MRIISISATSGRHQCIERAVRLFIDQDYKGDHTLLIYNNSGVYQELDVNYDILPSNKTFILINQHIDSTTRKPYSNLGAIYNDILNYVPEDFDLITFSDDDDLYLPNHISEGIKGYLKAKTINPNYKAYKPQYSLYRDQYGISLASNTMEPSIFVERKHIIRYGFTNTTSDQHLSWVNPLIVNNEIFVDPEGTPTLIYNWGDTNIPTFKTSGDPNNPNNFNNYRKFSNSHGDQKITPLTKEQVEPYYKQALNFKTKI